MTTEHKIPLVQRISAVLWPSFIVAGIANSFFFVFFAPNDLLLIAGINEGSQIGVYSIGFFIFWMITACSSAATTYFLRVCHIPVQIEEE